jgi:hypothetical protein
MMRKTWNDCTRKSLNENLRSRKAIPSVVMLKNGTGVPFGICSNSGFGAGIPQY